LDGELWFDRDEFQKCVSICRKKVPEPEEWKKLKYIVFDAPGISAPFEKRYEAFQKVVKETNSPYIVGLPH
jgi:DNA ligase-1